MFGHAFASYKRPMSHTINISETRPCPPHPRLCVLPKPGGATGFPRPLLIKPDRTFNEIIQGLLSDGKPFRAEVTAQESNARSALAIKGRRTDTCYIILLPDDCQATEEYIWHSSVAGKQNGVLEVGNSDVAQPRKTCDIIILMGARRVEISPTYIPFGDNVLPAIYPRHSEAKIPCDIQFICQIFFRAKCFSKFNVSQVLTKASPIGYSQTYLEFEDVAFCNLSVFHNNLHDKQVYIITG